MRQKIDSKKKETMIETGALDHVSYAVVNSSMEYRTVVAKSPIIKEKLEIVDRIAQTDSSVLILGESGSEKEVFAELIHVKSARNGKPFVKLNCASVPNELLKSELLGSFELAGGGTIFLDEIHELSLVLQAKLLTVTVDVRVIAATSRDMEKRLETGKFRSDLYYRLNVLPLVIPPLRQRKEDIPELAELLLKKSMKETQNHFDGFSSEAMEAMISYSWPGNIRELQNCIERAGVTAKGRRISPADLFLGTGQPSATADADAVDTDVSAASVGGDRNLKNAENIFRKRYIRQILEENNWNQTETAKALDIQRTYLSRLIKELGINNTKG